MTWGLAPFRQLIRERIGLQIRPADEQDLRRLIETRLRVSGLTDGAYLQRLQGCDALSQAEWEVLAHALTIGESYFFRDPGQMALLQRTLLPQLLQSSTTRPLRLLSAGCSTGEEPYSLAMLLDRLLFGSWAGRAIQIDGLDIKRESLQIAAAGCYGEWSFRGVSHDWRETYFSRAGDTWALHPELRRRVRFLPFNLIGQDLPDPVLGLNDYDLILCRNLLIYFDAGSIAQLVVKFRALLRPGGYLLTGHGELQGVPMTGFENQLHEESLIYRRVEANAPAPAPVLAPIRTLSARPAAPSRPKAGAQSVSLPESFSQLYRTGRYPDLVAAARRRLQDRPRDSEALRWLARAQADLGQQEAARSGCAALLRLNPLDAEAHYLQAQIELDVGADVAAETLLKQALYLEPRFVAPYLALATLTEQTGNSARAMQLRRTALRLLESLPAETEVPLLEDTPAGSLRVQISALLAGSKH
ncbi:chemotaxis protein methyltransferase CheR [Gammaproteobacteria bacterium]